jgi:hypothetical protein
MLLRAMKIRHRDKVTKLDNCEKKLGRQGVDLILLKEERNNYKAASESNKAESDSYKAMAQDLSSRLNSKHDLIRATEEFLTNLGYNENAVGHSAC